MEIVEDCTSEIIQVKIKIVNKTELIFSELTLKMKWWRFSFHETYFKSPCRERRFNVRVFQLYSRSPNNFKNSCSGLVLYFIVDKYYEKDQS